MSLRVTLTGDAANYLIRGAIYEVAAAYYRAYVHLVPLGPRLDFSRSVVSVVSVGGQTFQEVLDTAIARVVTATGTPVQNLRVLAAPRDSEAVDAAVTA